MDAAHGDARNATRSATSRVIAGEAERDAAKRDHRDLAADFVFGGAFARYLLARPWAHSLEQIY